MTISNYNDISILDSFSSKNSAYKSELSSLDYAHKNADDNSYTKVQLQIRNGFLELLNIHSYNKINVVDISTHSKVSRQTFYNYYQSKDDLLLSFMDELFDEFYETSLASTSSLMNGDIFSTVLEELFTVWKKHDQAFYVMMNAGVDGLIYQRLRSYTNRAIGSIIRRKALTVTNPKLIEYFVEGSTGSSFHLLKLWVNQGMPYSAQEMAKLCMLFFGNDLNSLLEGLETTSIKK